MTPTTEILANVSRNSKKNKNEVFTRLYRYMLRPDLYYTAYQNLYSNNGAATKGVNSDTADGFSEEKVNKIIESLRDETYKPSPVRRTQIKKENVKKRPLGIPTFSDKLVQEVLRMILEAVYESIFAKCSHGFRPNKSCHTALKSLKKGFNGTRWFIEGDIKGCFDNINHQVLTEFIGTKIKDAKLIKLIWKFLKAGYLENWKFNATYSGTPQGGIVSPIFANIYLHELDKFVLNLAEQFNKPRVQLHTTEYNRIKRWRDRLKPKIEKAEGEERKVLIEKAKELRKQQLKTPCKSQTDKKISYVRYADDFLIGVNGSKADCTKIKQQLSEFISGVLKMELSKDKTLITHSSEYARFLGYDVKVRRNGNTRKTTRGTARTLSQTTELLIPIDDKIMKFLFSKKVIFQSNDGTIHPCARIGLTRCSELEIVTAFNAELRGICNYYSMADNFDKLNYFAYLMEYSCLKTLARKHKSTLSKTIEKFKTSKGKWAIPYETRNGTKFRYFADYRKCKMANNFIDEIDKTAVRHQYSRTVLEERLSAKECELCGEINAKHYEIHHVHKVKDLKGKALWEQVMIAKQRKTMVLCRECHKKIHGKRVS